MLATLKPTQQQRPRLHKELLPGFYRIHLLLLTTLPTTLHLLPVIIFSITVSLFLTKGLQRPYLPPIRASLSLVESLSPPRRTRPHPPIRLPRRTQPQGADRIPQSTASRLGRQRQLLTSAPLRGPLGPQVPHSAASPHGI